MENETFDAEKNEESNVREREANFKLLMWALLECSPDEPLYSDASEPE